MRMSTVCVRAVCVHLFVCVRVCLSPPVPAIVGGLTGVEASCCTVGVPMYPPISPPLAQDLYQVNDRMAALHKAVARASALPDYKEKKAEYVRPRRLPAARAPRACLLVCAVRPAAAGRECVARVGKIFAWSPPLLRRMRSNDC
jgi:hypothetical protein